MNLASVLSLLSALEPMLKQELLSLEPQAIAELNTIIGNVSSPDLKELLQALASGVDAFAKLEINKLP